MASDTRRAAEALWEVIYKAMHVDETPIDAIARALDAAEQRGYRAGVEAAAKQLLLIASTMPDGSVRRGTVELAAMEMANALLTPAPVADKESTK